MTKNTMAAALFHVHHRKNRKNQFAYERTGLKLTVGIVLAVYTGVISSRLVGFYDSRAKASEELIVLPRAIFEARHLHTARFIIVELWTAPRVSLLAQGQRRAAKTLHDYYLRMAHELHAELTACMTIEERTSKIGAPEAPSAARWHEIVREFQGKLLARKHVDWLDTLRPDYGAIFEIPALDRLLRRSDCANCCENCRRTL